MTDAREMADEFSWMGQALAYIESWLGHQMRTTGAPGCAIAVAHCGQIVLDAAFGKADLLSGEALTSRHRFRVASHSKTFTAAAIMKLRDEGRIALDDRLGRFVDGLHADLAAATVEQLLSNGTGMVRDGYASSYWSGRIPFPDVATLRADLTLPPAIPVGSRFKYSSHGFALAGLIIEAVVKEPYGAWMQREIIAPAGLTETLPDAPANAEILLASGHGDALPLGRRPRFPGAQSTRALAPAAGFVSTAADLCRFFSQLSPRASKSFLSEEARREIIREHRRDPSQKGNQGYGLGVMTDTCGDWTWFGHGGGFPGYITKTVMAPEPGITVSVLTNARDGKAHEWANGALGILQRFARASQTLEPDRRWAGRWWNVWGPADLVAMGDHVLLASPDLLEPLDGVPEIRLEGPDQGVIVEASGFHHLGEKVWLRHPENPDLAELQVAGDIWLPEARFSAELVERYG